MTRVVGRAPARRDCDSPLVLQEDSGREWTKRCGATSSDRCKHCAATYRTRVFWVAESGRRMYPGDSTVMITLTAPSHEDQHCRRHKDCDGRGGDA